MSRARVIVAVLLLCAAAGAQSAVSVPYHKSISLQVEGATAAYSMDSQIAEASALNGVLVVEGVRPGTTSVVVVTPAGPKTFRVTVVPPAPLRVSAAASPTEGGEGGSYEFRYSSDPGQFNNSIEFHRYEGDSLKRLQIISAEYLNASVAPVALPFVSYSIANERRAIVFGDATVDSSPLTVDGSVVRGFHWRRGPWAYHIGYSSMATFENYLLATDPQYVFGVSRAFRLSARSSITASTYGFHNPRSFRATAPDGVIGSVAYRYQRGRDFDFLSEIGLGRTVAFAARARYEGARQQLYGRFRYEPRKFASLALGNLHGTFADVTYNRVFNARLSAGSSFVASKYQLPQLRQNIYTSTASLALKLSRFLTLNGGETFSAFSTDSPAAFSSRTLSIPVGLQFASRHLSLGGQFQPTTDFQGPLAKGYSVNAGTTFRTLFAGAYYRHDVQTFATTALPSPVAGLREAMQQSAAYSATAEQTSALLDASSLLRAIGLSGGLAVYVARARDDVGANAGWTSTGSRHQRFDFSFLNSRAELDRGSTTYRSVSARYSFQLDADNEAAFSASVFQQTGAGAATTTRPLFEVSFRHRFRSAPSLLLPGRQGDISGHVFRDDHYESRFTGQQAPIPGAVVVLDELRTVRTDANGFYRFRDVPFGSHQVRVSTAGNQPSFFTTASPATVEINQTADFGVSFLAGQVFGKVLNDAGSGVPGVIVELRGASATLRAHTDAIGQFRFAGLQEGAYTVATVADSYPPEYDLQKLETKTADVVAGAPRETDFHVRALRAVTGMVGRYDPARSTIVPVSGAVLRIPELGIETTSGVDGKFAFRNLPAGDFHLQVRYQDRQAVVPFSLPPQPFQLRNLDVTLPPR